MQMENTEMHQKQASKNRASFSGCPRSKRVRVEMFKDSTVSFKVLQTERINRHL